MITIKIILFVSRKYPDGSSPVMLRATQRRKKIYIKLGFQTVPGEWDKKQGQFKTNHTNHRKRNMILTAHKKRALKIIDEFYEYEKEITLSKFKDIFLGEKVGKKITIYDFIQEKIKTLQLAERIGNARTYDEMQKSFFGFINDKKLLFPDLDLTMLENYEAYLRSRGGTGGGISVKMRTLRAVYNDAIKKGFAKQEHYPFKHYDMSKLKSTGIKKALTREEVRLIQNLDTDKYPLLINFKHYFVFSYFTRGMNFVDMLKLKWSDITDDRITYIRSKTGRLFIIKVIEPIQEILDYYKALPSNTNYIFPILLKEGLTEAQIQNRKKKTLKQYNKGLKEIARILKIEKTLTSYVARHSFATNLKHAGVNISIISESMGHANLEVTEHYLKEFENEVIDQATEKLL